MPKHIAVIMDGNGRWAAARGLSRSQGHLAGVEAVRTLVRECRTMGIPYVTVYAFSRENWQRPKTEVSFLFDLFLRFIREELPELLRQDIRLAFMGEKSDLPFAVRQVMQLAESKTAGCASMTLTIALNYAGREEILSAVRRAVADGVPADSLTDERLRSYMYAPWLPDPDLIIRTSGELRLSNFLLYQGAYSELYFSDVLWPDFGPAELQEALRSYASRTRRFGKTDAQIQSGE
ncbi:MAG: polyprenyl diphosphate synthase [Mailhella sp.]|nr:polyprenyl diphosphate synthase [Mailhella sp.]